ncbi:hypothetical protein AS200_42590 [Streptomyces sp. CdTB01]|nr:hypothetical protein AS200_42590 [Streptomyces sp. CdTB01]
MTRSEDAAVLDEPVGESLRGHHTALARRLGRDGFADLFSCPATPPPEWEPVFALDGRQMIWTGERSVEPRAASGDLVELSATDVPEMLDLAAQTQPGPFWPRTHELGTTYLGIRAGGSLVAMAGEGTNVPFCTSPRRTPPRSPSTRGSASKAAHR